MKIMFFLPVPVLQKIGWGGGRKYYFLAITIFVNIIIMPTIIFFCEDSATEVPQKTVKRNTYIPSGQ